MLNQTTGLWHSVAQGENTSAVRSERSRTSGEACPELVEGSKSALRVGFPAFDFAARGLS
jgi:hypothetical protein